MERFRIQISKCIFLTCGAVISSVCMALPVGFSDLGNITVDHNSGLEWLDVTETASTSYEDMINELSSGSGLGSNGWRHATQLEFQQLISNFFNVSYTGGSFGAGPFSEGDSTLVEQFIHTFGDSLWNGWQIQDEPYLIESDQSGYTYGFLADNSEPGKRFQGRVTDFEYYSIVPGTNTILDFVDGLDGVNDSSSISETWVSDFSGHYLVRDAQNVSEPTSLALLLLGLIPILKYRVKRTLV